MFWVCACFYFCLLIDSENLSFVENICVLIGIVGMDLVG